LKVLGIDPGLSITGYGVVEQKDNTLKHIVYGGIRKKTGVAFSESLLSIYDKISEIVTEYNPDACAIENIFYHQNKKTAIVMGHVRGVAIVAVARRQIPVFEYSPREVKLSTVGMGAASKIQVQSMVRNILSMDEVPHPEDAADALAVAICHFHRIKLNRYYRK
jgi:crossover junction endodeoxyribonuclease RuvC